MPTNDRFGILSIFLSCIVHSNIFPRWDNLLFKYAKIDTLRWLRPCVSPTRARTAVYRVGAARRLAAAEAAMHSST